MPVLLAFLLMLVTFLPLGIANLSHVMPSFGLTAVYYWSIYRPNLMPPFAIFCLGILQDTLSGGVIGVTALIFLLVHAVCVSQRRFFLSGTFLVAWWGFLIVAAGASVAVYLILSLYYFKIFNPVPALIQYFLTLLVYPLLAFIFSRVDQRLFVRT